MIGTALLRRPLALLATVLAVGAASSVNAQEVTIATWGGSYGKAIQEAVATPFEKATGVKVKMIAGVSLSNMQMIAAQKANPQVDIITLTTQDATRAYADGLLAPLEATEIPNVKDINDVGIRRDANGKTMFAGIWMYPFGIAYRTDKITWDLKSWNDLWDPRLKDKVAVSSPKYMSAYFMLMVNKLAGGTEQNIDPGIARIKGMGKNLLAVVDDSAGQQRVLMQGEVWAVPMLASSATQMVTQGAPVKFIIPSDGAPVGVDVVALVKGGPRQAEAKKFINFFLSPEGDGKVAEILQITPMNTKVALGPHAIRKEDMGKLVTFSEKAINEQRAAWLERWERDISPMTTR